MALKLSKIARCRLYDGLFKSSKYVVSAHRIQLFSNQSTTTPSSAERLLALMDYYADKPVGMCHELYHARVYFTDIWDSACSSPEHTEFAKYSSIIRAYISSKDGLSDVEKQAIAREANCWCPHLSIKEIENICDEAAKLTEKEALKVADQIREKYPEKKAQRALLLNSLTGASIDGLDINEIKGFRQIAERIGISDDTINEMISMYKLEAKLKQKYNEFYNKKT